MAPGWWQAADGRWYPPHLAPGASPWPVGAPDAHGSIVSGPPLAAAGRRSVAGGLSGTLQGFFWAAGALAVFAAVLALVALAGFETWWDTPVRSAAEAEALEDWVDADDAFAGFAALFSLVGVVVLVLLVVWTFQVYRATEQLWSGPRTWSIGWTIGAWFVLGANLVLPKLVINELERLSLAERVDRAVRDGWQRRSTMLVGWLWWIAYVVGLVLTLIGAGTGDDVDSSATEVRMSYVLSSIGFASLAVGSVCGALYVRRIGRRVSACGIIEQP